MATIKAPNKAYTGISAGVPFVNGVGETERPELLDWFRAHGYEVEEPAAFVCPYCGKEYKTEKGLAEHIATEHQPPEGGDGEQPPEGGDGEQPSANT